MKDNKMTKIVWKPGTMLSPLPPALISCGTVEKPNVMTVAWTGIISSEPPMTYVSIRPTRFSHDIIKESGEFVINLPNLALLVATDWCGVKSGRNVDKFKEMNLTAIPCSQISAPQIEQAPVSVECKLKSVLNFGTHDMFIAEIVAVNVDDKYLDEAGKLCLEKAGLLAFSHGKYFTLGRELGSFGFSVNKARIKDMKKVQDVEVTVKQSKVMLDDDGNVIESEKKSPRGRGDREIKPSKPRVERRFDDKPYRPKEGMERRLGEKRPYKAREDGEDRPRRDDAERKPYRPREEGNDRPRRDFGDRPRRPSGDGERRPYRPREGGSDRPRRDDGEKRPYRPREEGNDRPRRDFGDRPRRPSSDGEKRPYRPREGGSDRPRRDFGDRPQRPSGDGERRPYKPREGGNDRPRRDDGEKRPYKPREGGSSGGDRRPSGPRKPYVRK